MWMIMGRRVVVMFTCYVLQLFAFGTRSGKLFLLAVPSFVVFLGARLSEYLDGSVSKKEDLDTALFHPNHIAASILAWACCCWFMPDSFTTVVPYTLNLSTILPSSFGNVSASP